MGKNGETTGVPIFLRGKQALNIRVLRFRAKNYSRSPTPIAPTLSFRVRRLVRPMNHRRHLRYRLPQRAVEWLHDPAVHLLKTDRARGHLTRPGPTQIKQLATNRGSVESPHHEPRRRRPLDDQLASKSQGTIRKTIPVTALHGFARKGVCSACRPGIS